MASQHNRLRLAEMTKSQKSATSWSLLCMLVLVTTLITKIHGKHLCKEDMT